LRTTIPDTKKMNKTAGDPSVHVSHSPLFLLLGLGLGLLSVLGLGFTVRVELYFGTDNLNHIR